MTPQEFEQALHDTEVRLSRLKALYEQWFQGIERTEPQVARKDFDRALEVLKKSLPRNTALRFRTQQLVARYGTYSLYWTRIAKQIEDGTYRRELNRLRERAQRKAQQEREKPEAVELDLEQFEQSGGADFGDFGDSDLDAIFGALTSDTERPPAKEAPKEAPRAAGPRPPAAAPNSPSGVRPGTDAANPVATSPAVPSPPAAPALPGAKPPDSGAIAIGRLARPAATGGVREESGEHSRSVRLTPAMLERPPQVAPAGAPAAPVGPPGAPKPPPPAVARPPVPPAPPARPLPPPPRPPVPGAAPPAPAAALPKPPIVAPPRPALPAAPVPVAAPVRAPVAPPAPRPAAPAPAAAREAGGPDVRALFDRYVEARRKNNERVDNVKLETLQASVEKMMPKLREKHGNKAIDFDIVLQDGKVGLKPKVR